MPRRHMDLHLRQERRPQALQEALDYPLWDSLPGPCRAQLAAVLTEMVGQYLQGEEGDRHLDDVVTNLALSALAPGSTPSSNQKTGWSRERWRKTGRPNWKPNATSARNMSATARNCPVVSPRRRERQSVPLPTICLSSGTPRRRRPRIARPSSAISSRPSSSRSIVRVNGWMSSSDGREGMRRGRGGDGRSGGLRRWKATRS